MECASCLGTCGGQCPVCEGKCGSGKKSRHEIQEVVVPTFNVPVVASGGDQQVCMPKKDYDAEHKRLINVLEQAGKEGERQKKEVEERGGFISPVVPSPLDAYRGRGKPMLLEEAILAHYDMGHNFEVLKIKETPSLVTYNIAQHGVNWKPTKAVVDKINKLFHTFHFTTTGRMTAQRGREFARDAEVLTKMLKAYEVNGAYNLEGGTHRENFLKAHKLEDKGYTLNQLAKISYVPLKTLREVYNRGIGAYKTQPSSVRLKGSFVKGVKAPMSAKLSKEQWAMARVYSFLDGNPKHDEDLRGGGPAWRRPAEPEPEDEDAVQLRRINTAVANGELPDVIEWFHGLNLDFSNSFDTLGDPILDRTEYFFLIDRDRNLFLIPTNTDDPTLEAEMTQTLQDHDVVIIIRSDVNFPYTGWVEALPEVRFSQIGVDMPEGIEDIIDTEPINLGEEVVYARNGVLNPIRSTNARTYRTPEGYTTAARIPDLTGVVRGSVGSGRRR